MAVAVEEPQSLVLVQRPLVPELSSLVKALDLVWGTLVLMLKPFDLLPKILVLDTLVLALKVQSLILLSVLLLEQTPLMV